MNLPGIRCQRGVALLEVLIVFFVLSIGLLGMAALQIKSIQYSQSSYLRSQATVAANDMLDRIRLHGGEEFDAGDPELTDWETFVTGTLPMPKDEDGALTNPPLQECTGSSCTITITWEDRFDTNGDGNYTETLVVTSQM